MNTEYKNDWVAALRSGRYTQAKKVLREARGEYCVVGVLGQVAGFNPGPTGKLTHEQRNKVGLTYEQESTLNVMNDQGGYNFSQLADWIERNL